MEEVGIVIGMRNGEWGSRGLDQKQDRTVGCVERAEGMLKALPGVAGC